MARLTEQEKQDIIRHLEADRPLPDKYRFLLFEDKREVELVWNGKTGEVCNVVKVSKDAQGIVSRERLTQHWTDWIDYWAVDFNFESKRELIRVPREPAKQIQPAGLEQPEQPEMPQYEEVWTGDYIFENEWQSFRTKKERSIELTSAFHECEPGRRKLAVKVVDIFGNDTMTIIEVAV